jgi:HD superfamily phosphohydrolase
MILRDPVHGLVSFETEEQAIVPALLEAAEVQRLRRIRQLGLASFAYPGADHTRFSHAVGAAFVMTRFIARLRALHDALPFWQRVTTERAREALAAALLHDVGHGPFSHLFEEALPQGPRHEQWTTRVICDTSTEVNRILRRFDAALPARVAELVHGRHELTFLARAVSGLFDVDRCDYLLRDAHATGVGYGAFDLDWLLRSLRLAVPTHEDRPPPLAIDGAKGLPAIESFILARLFMFQQVYFHKASRASEWMLSRIIERAMQVVADGARLNGMPVALTSLAREGEAPLGEYLALDDAVMWVAIATFRDASDPVLRDLSQRLHARRLFKTYELFGDQGTPERRVEVLTVARDVARRAGLEPDVYVGLDVASDAPFDDSEEPLTVIFPRGEPKKPGDVSFLLGRLRGEHLARTRLIFAPELRDAIVEAVET